LLRLFLEEIVEMSRFLEAEAVTNLSYVPVSMLQQSFGFAQESAGNMVSGCFAGRFPDGTVEVIDVHR
jgi:hypothetical protein